MPLYDYTCELGHQFEAYREYGRHRTTVCPICGSASSFCWRTAPAIAYGDGLSMQERAAGDMVWEPGWEKDVARRRSEIEKKNDAKRFRVVEDTFRDFNMPGDGGVDYSKA